MKQLETVPSRDDIVAYPVEDELLIAGEGEAWVRSEDPVDVER